MIEIICGAWSCNQIPAPVMLPHQSNSFILALAFAIKTNVIATPTPAPLSPPAHSYWKERNRKQEVSKGTHSFINQIDLLLLALHFVLKPSEQFLLIGIASSSFIPPDSYGNIPNDFRVQTSILNGDAARPKQSGEKLDSVFVFMLPSSLVACAPKICWLDLRSSLSDWEYNPHADIIYDLQK